MYGNYLIDHGVYKLTIQNVIKKDFLFQQGSTIVFGGDPYNSALNMKAKYTVTGVPLSDLEIGNSFKNNNVRVDCMMNITGTPESPHVEFDLDLPTLGTDMKQMIRSLINSEEEMNQQVIYLLAIGRFYNQRETRSNEQQSQTSLAMQSLLSGTVSQQINNVLSSLTNNSNWNFGANISTGDEGFYNAEYEVTMTVGETITITIPDSVTKIDYNSQYSLSAQPLGKHNVKVTYSGGEYVSQLPVTGIQLNRTSAVLTRTYKKPKPTMQLKATITPANAGNTNLKWYSSNKKVATVSQSGKVTARGAGKAKIICEATDGSGVRAVCKITVKDKKITKIGLTKKKVTLKVGKKLTLKVKITPSSALNRKLKWTSSNEKVATVNSEGIVKARGKGQCIITCKATDGSKKKATCRITVK